MHRDCLHSICRLAATSAALGRAGCLPCPPAPPACGRSGPSLQPREALAVATLGPAQVLPARAYEPEPPGKGAEGAPGKKGPTMQIPPELPGADAPPIKLPGKLLKDDAQAAK